MDRRRPAAAPQISERGAKVAEWRQERLGIDRMSLAPALRGRLSGTFLC